MIDKSIFTFFVQITTARYGNSCSSVATGLKKNRMDDLGAKYISVKSCNVGRKKNLDCACYDLCFNVNYLNLLNQM